MTTIEMQTNHINKVPNELMTEEEYGGCHPLPLPLSHFRTCHTTSNYWLCSIGINRFNRNSGAVARKDL